MAWKRTINCGFRRSFYLFFNLYSVFISSNEKHINLTLNITKSNKLVKYVQRWMKSMRKKGEKKQITNEKEFDLARNKPFWVFFMYVYSIKLQQNGKSKYLNACIVMPKVTRSNTWKLDKGNNCLSLCNGKCWWLVSFTEPANWLSIKCSKQMPIASSFVYYNLRKPLDTY